MAKGTRHQYPGATLVRVPAQGYLRAIGLLNLKRSFDINRPRRSYPGTPGTRYGYARYGYPGNPKICLIRYRDAYP
eukprot:2786141-Rhodomonas_salina.1